MYTKVAQCSVPECQEPATHKVAAPWTYGTFSELKTYGLACSDHPAPVLAGAQRRHKDYAVEPGETVEEIGVYRYERGKADSQLERIS